MTPLLRAVLGLGLLCGFAALGQGLMNVLRLPFPGSVAGLLLLLAALSLKLIRLEWVGLAGCGLLGRVSRRVVRA